MPGLFSQHFHLINDHPDEVEHHQQKVLRGEGWRRGRGEDRVLLQPAEKMVL